MDINDDIIKIVDDMSKNYDISIDDIQRTLNDNYPNSQPIVFYTGGHGTPEYAIKCYGVAWLNGSKILSTHSFVREFK